MRVLEKTELGRILDCDDALPMRYHARQTVQQGGLATARATNDRDALAHAHSPFQQHAHLGLDRAHQLHFLKGDDMACELADSHVRTAKTHGRHDNVHTVPLRQACVDQRRRLVDASSERTEDAVNQRPQLGCIGESLVGPFEHSITFYVDHIGAGRRRDRSP